MFRSVLAISSHKSALVSRGSMSSAPSTVKIARRYATPAGTPEHLGKFDVCVIGCGPAGFAAAMRAWDYKKKVCIVEKNRIGGAGLHDGALASKTMWEISEDFKTASRKGRGYGVERLSVEFCQLREEIETAIRAKENQMQQQIMRLGIPLFQGIGSFLNNKELLVTADKKQSVIDAENFVVATGSAPRQHETIATDGSIIMTSDDILKQAKFPRSMVILGAGVVGCEYATIFSNFGNTKVYLIDRADRILPSEDADIAEVLSQRMERKGITVHHGAKLVSMRVVDAEVEYVLEYPKLNNMRRTYRVEKALLSIGRVPSLGGLNLEKAGVKISPKGQIVHTDSQTTAPNIYAVGDATVDIALVNIAEIEGRHAVEKMYGGNTKPLTYSNISTIMFVDPRVAGVGMNEEELTKRKIPYKVAVCKYSLVARAIAKAHTEGFVKLLVTNDNDMKLLGIRALGAASDAVIEICSFMIKHGKSAIELKDLLSAYPSITEGMQECVRLLFNESIVKPDAFPRDIHLTSVTFDAKGNAVRTPCLVTK